MPGKVEFYDLRYLGWLALVEDPLSLVQEGALDLVVARGRVALQLAYLALVGCLGDNIC